MTLDEAIFEILAANAKAVDKIRAMFAEGKNLDEVATLAHFGFGMKLRNQLKLWTPESAPLKKEIWAQLTEDKREFYTNWWVGKGDFKDETMHADDASHELLLAALKVIRDTEKKS